MTEIVTDRRLVAHQQKIIFYRIRAIGNQILIYTVLTGLLIFALAPLVLAWFTAFKTGEQIIFNPFGPPIPPHFDNLIEAWIVGKFNVYFMNSLIISVSDVIIMLIVAPLAGYAFGRMKFPGQRILLFLFLGGLTITVTAIIIPLYLIMRDFHLLNTYYSVIVADVALAAPFFIFMMRAFFKDIPNELDDAARIDGCSEFKVFWHIMLPLAKPGLLTVALLEFLWSWNDLLLRLIFLTNDDLRTLTVGMLFYQGRFSIDYGLMAAGVLIISAPVILMFLVFQRSFVQGLTGGALKG
ncbi:MAG: carbohydrate ABC transporter permease [Anaerolineae bacterium]|nr:carbohydrate ABC transporter permease [Anaerolineae bacterium]